MQPVAIVLCAAIVLFGLERLAPSVRLPRVQGWAARLLALNVVQVGVVFLAASTWDRWLPQFKLFDSSGLPAVAGVAIGYVLITFVYYWWHRVRHESRFLWRYLHQVHHSPARIECLMSFYKHPIEIAINGVLSSTVLYVLVGLPPTSVAVVVTITGVAELIYHSNLRTPWWLGFLFQRPEMHRRHHESGWHRSNFSDLPIWDLLFGTFDNPKQTPVTCGFARQAERDLLGLMFGRKSR
jgi:sterol desaturase/sphingolipid hydroxylase (fatty acid hydroxylase superfamily)